MPKRKLQAFFGFCRHSPPKRFGSFRRGRQCAVRRSSLRAVLRLPPSKGSHEQRRERQRANPLSRTAAARSSLGRSAEDMSLPCPCCGYRTMEGDFYGSYEICAVCGWEDDAVQLANPCSDGGANKESLFQCQRARTSWSKEKIVGFERDPMWRPLTATLGKTWPSRSR